MTFGLPSFPSPADHFSRTSTCEESEEHALDEADYSCQILRHWHKPEKQTWDELAILKFNSIRLAELKSSILSAERTLLMIGPRDLNFDKTLELCKNAIVDTDKRIEDITAYLESQSMELATKSVTLNENVVKLTKYIITLTWIMIAVGTIQIITGVIAWFR